MSNFRKCLYYVMGAVIICGSFYLNYDIYQNNQKLKSIILEMKMANDEVVYKIGGIDQEIVILSNFIQTVNPKCDKNIAEHIAKSIIRVSEEKDFFYGMVVGIIGAESAFNPFEVSSYGARGLMQVANVVHKKYDAYKLHDIEYNVRAGIEIYQEILNRKNNDHIATLLEYVHNSNEYVIKVHKIIGFYFTFRDVYISSGKDNARSMLSKYLNGLIYVKGKKK